MTRREHPTEEYVRRLPLVSDEQAAVLSDRSAKQALFEEITTLPTTTDTPPAAPTQPPARHRMPRRSLVLATVLTILSIAAVGGAAVRWLAEQTTSVACHTDDSSVLVVDSVTGDPVEDCQAAWRDAGLQPPALIAYDNGHGGIAVLPAGEEAPAGWEPLEPGVVQNPRLIQLEAALADYGSGLHAECHLLSQARTLAQREIDRLELEGWTIRAERGEADGTETCTYFFLDPEQQAVVLIPMQGLVAPDAPFTVFARDLARTLEEDCLPTTEAAQVTREVAARAGVNDTGLIIHEVTDDTLDCARSNVTVGGRVEVTIRGPETTP